MFILHLLADPIRPAFAGERLFTTIALCGIRLVREDVPNEIIRYVSTFLRENGYKAFSVKERNLSHTSKKNNCKT